MMGFPCASAGKESACNAGDLGSIPGLGRSPEERRGYPLQCSVLENSMDSPWRSPWGRKELDRTEQLSLSLCCDGYPSPNKLCEQVQGWLKELPGSGIAGSFRSRAISASVENVQLLSRLVQAIHLPTGNVQGFLFLCFIATVWCYQIHQCLPTWGCGGCLHVFAFP